MAFDKQLQEYIAKSDVLFEKANQILEADAIGYIHKKNKTIFSTNISFKNQDYHVEVNTEHLHLSKCECKTYETYEKCEHVVALAYKIFSKRDLEIENQKKQEKHLYNRFNNFIGIDQEDKKKINIRTKFYVNNIDYLISFDLVVKEEGKREYIVKNQIEFINAIIENKEYKLNSSFVLFENDYILNDQSNKIINLIATKIKNLNSKINFEEIKLSIIEFKDLLKVYENDDVIELNYLEIKKSALPFSEILIDIQLQDEEIVFTNKQDLKIEEVIPNEVILINQNIYILQDEQVVIYEIFKELINKKVDKFVLNKKYFEKFMIDTKGKLTKVFNLNLASELDQEVIVEKLEPIIEVKKDLKNNLVIKADFKYGEISYGFDGEQKSEKPRLVKRDEDLEREILDKLFAKKGKKKVNTHDVNELVFDSPKLMFDVLNEGLNQLKENKLATIKYYDDTENMIEYINKKRYKIAIKENSTKDNYFEYDFDITGISKAEIDDIINSYEENQKFYKTKEKNFIAIDDDLVKKIKLIRFIRNELEGNTGEIPLYYLFFLKEESEKLFDQIDIDNVFKKYFERLNTYEKQDVENENVKLREYQKKGVEWLRQLEYFKFGGILADEMGLGKTLQILTFLKGKKENKALIVVPKALIYNWEEEIKKFSSDTKVSIVIGNKEQRKQIIRNYKDGIIITSYNMLRLDVDMYEAINFDYSILDEAQYIKNPTAKITKSVKKLKSINKFALSGTPIENNLMDLWSIFDYIMPGFFLSHKEFEKKYVKNIDNQQYLQKLINPFLLRRKKVDVLKELPDKIETPIYCSMTNEQKVLYAKYINDYTEELDSFFAQEKNNVINMLSILTRLRQIATHPAMFIDGYDGGSQKLEAIMETIEENIENDNKVIVFSQFVSMLKIVESELKKEGIDYYYLDGKTKARQRVEMTKQFNKDDKKIFLISLKAGGVGLNLTSANTVIHIDPWWNPAVENQATDRAHRIGQKNVLQVNKFITKGTIEEKIYELKKKKEELLESTIINENTLFSEMDMNEIKSLFEFEI